VSNRNHNGFSASAKLSAASISKEINDMSNTKQQSYPASADNIVKEASSRTQDDSAAGSSHSTAGTTQGKHSKLLNFLKSFLLMPSQIQSYLVTMSLRALSPKPITATLIPISIPILTQRRILGLCTIQIVG
jgi:hypothetical protein